MVRYSFNRYKDGKSYKEIYNILGTVFPNMSSHLRNCSARQASTIYLLNKDKKVHFGKFKKFQKGLITKDEYKDSKNLGIYSEGVGVALKRKVSLYKLIDDYLVGVGMGFSSRNKEIGIEYGRDHSPKYRMLNEFFGIVSEFFNMMMVVDASKTTKDISEVINDLDAIGNEIGVVIKCQREEIFDKMHRI